MKVVPGLDSYYSSEELSRVPLFVNYSDSLLTFAYVCCGVLMVVGIPGNLITIIALSRYKKVQNATATFIVNLHISDLLFCCTVLPIITATYAEKQWVFGKTICKLFPYVRMSLCMVGMLILMAISINRYILVCHPTWYIKFYTKRNIRVMIIITWVIGCSIMLPTFFGAWGQLSLDPEVGLCTEVPDENGRNIKQFLISTSTVPCIVMQVCYTRIWWVARKSARKSRNKTKPNPSGDRGTQETYIELNSTQVDTGKFHSNTNLRSNTVHRRSIIGQQQHNLPTKKDKRLATMIIAIMATFYMCSLPLIIIKSVKGKLRNNPELNIIAYLMLTSASCIHAVVYGAMSREYRQAYNSLFKGMKNTWESRRYKT